MGETQPLEQATLGGGCFWCTEAVFDELKGVKQVVSGYANGHVPNPTYQAVCSGQTGHAEVIQLTFDPAEISYHDLLMVFFATHDPTTPNRQGADTGTQYRSGIYTHSDAQAATARQVLQELADKRLFDAPIVTEVEPLKQFYAAESYHQDYFARNPSQPYCVAVVAPKLGKFRQQFLAQLQR